MNNSYNFVISENVEKMPVLTFLNTQIVCFSSSTVFLSHLLSLLVLSNFLLYGRKGGVSGASGSFGTGVTTADVLGMNTVGVSASYEGASLCSGIAVSDREAWISSEIISDVVQGSLGFLFLEAVAGRGLIASFTS